MKMSPFYVESDIFIGSFKIKNAKTYGTAFWPGRIIAASRVVI